MEKLDTELKGIINEKLSKVYKNNSQCGEARPD